MENFVYIIKCPAAFKCGRAFAKRYSFVELLRKIEVTFSPKRSSAGMRILAKSLKVKGQTIPAKRTMRRYLIILAMYSFPKSATRGAESPDFIRRTPPRPSTSLINWAYQAAPVSNFIKIESTKYTIARPTVQPVRVYAFFIPLARFMASWSADAENIGK